MLTERNENEFFPVQTVAPKCFCCGQENMAGIRLHFRRESDIRLSTSLSIPEYWTGWGSLMHGGFHCVLLDEITAWVAFGLLDERSFLTRNIRVEYHKPVHVGRTIRVIGELVEMNEKTIVARGEIRDEDDALISEAVSTMVRIRPDRMNLIRHKD